MDIQILDPIQWIKARPERFFPSGNPTPIDLFAYYLVPDVLEFGNGSCTIRPVENWWIIGSEIDWLQNDKYSENELFEHIIPAPQHGRNAMRGEILLACFSQSVWLTLNGQRKRIQGNEAPASVWIQTSGLYRAIIFCLE
jgi:hypothetical protein